MRWIKGSGGVRYAVCGNYWRCLGSVQRAQNTQGKVLKTWQANDMYNHLIGMDYPTLRAAKHAVYQRLVEIKSALENLP